MRIFVVLLSVFMSLFIAEKSYSQEGEIIETQYIYIMDSPENLHQVEVDAEVKISYDVAYVQTSGEGASYVYDKVCFYKSDTMEREEEGGTSRIWVDCISGGGMMITNRPGQKKVSFINKEGENMDSYSSGLIYTNFSAESIEEVLFW